MVSKKQKKSYGILNIVSLILLCFFCAFTFCGCVGMGGLGGGLSGGSSGGSSPGGSGSGGSSSGGSSGGSGSGTGSSGGLGDQQKEPSINNYNDVFMGAIGVYEVDATQPVFFDKYKNSKVSFSVLRERQFDALSTYLYNSLEKIYGSTSASNLIGGYGEDKSFNFQDIINNSSQKIISGLKSGTLDNGAQLNYANSINGGYDLKISTSIIDNGDGTQTTQIDSIEYDTSVTGGVAWVSQSAFTKENLKNALGYIYKNTENVSNVDSVLGFSDNSLKSKYTGKRLTTTEISNFSLDGIKTLGFSKKYMWNVLYFLAYSVIGEDNINNSINNQSKVFSGDNIVKITSENYTSLETSFEKYKGYNIILPELVQKAFNLSIGNSNLIYLEYFDRSNWQTTLYPRVSCQEIIYFDNLEDVSDSQEEELSSDNEDDFSEDSMGNVIAGTPRKLRELIYLPKIDSSKFTGDNFKIEGVLLGLQTLVGNVDVEITFSAIFDDGSSISNIGVLDEDFDVCKNGKIQVDNIYNLNQDWIDCGFFEGDIPKTSRFTNIQLPGKDVSSSVEDVLSSFKSESFTVASTDEEIQLGVLNVYNNIIAIDYINQRAKLNVEKNILSLAFNYYNDSTLLENAPLMYLMYFDLFD